MIKTGISQVGGKYRLRKTLLKYTPYHAYFLSLFCGSCIYEVNKPKASHYECFNDLNPEFFNYLIVIKKYFEEFERRREEGPYGLVCRYLYDLMNKGVLTPDDMIEQAVQFFYRIKLSRGSRIKFNFRGLVPETTSKEKSIEEVKGHFRGLVGQREVDGNFKSNLGKTTRPISNNDCGILTPLDSKVFERLKYVILESLDFRECYRKFYTAYYKKKGLTKECFIYADPPFPGTEDYYDGLFVEDDHFDLIDLMLDTPFNFKLSMGGDCKIYLDIFKEDGWFIKEVYTSYSTNANHQKKDLEYLIMNYDINKLPLMLEDNQTILNKFM